MSIQQRSKRQKQNYQTTDYGEDTIESAREKARSLGLVVVFPRSNELFLDIDTSSAMEKFVRGVAHLGDVPYIGWPSPSGRPGRYHIVVTLPRPVSALERLALQSMLGSDSTREILSWLRLQRGIGEPTIFFERPAVARVPDIAEVRGAA